MDSDFLSFLTRLRNLWAGERPSHLFDEWSPSAPRRKDDRWFVLLNDAQGSLLNTYPWCFGTHFFRGDSWERLREGEKADLVFFLKRIASVIPDSVWPDFGSDKPLDPPLAVCCDIRLCNFSLVEFDKPEVVEFINQSVQKAKRQLSQVPRETDGLPSRPIKDYKFSPFRMGKRRIEVGWYLHRNFIRWPEPDILRRVPDAIELKQKLDDLARSAKELAPEPSFLEKLKVPAQPAERRRPSFDRLLDASTIHEEFAELDILIEPAHDYSIAVFQVWLDRITGHAFPLFEDNKTLTNMIADRADRYGIRLFFEWKGELAEVRIYAKLATASKQSNPEGAAALAGNFAIRSYDPAEKKSGTFSNVAIFPQLIAARSVEHARSILDARKSKPPE